MMQERVGEPGAASGRAGRREAQGLWVPARDVYAQALARFPDARLEESDVGATLASLVAGRLAREPFDRMAPDRPRGLVRWR